VKESFKLHPFSKSFFVFCNRQKNKPKILKWEHNGFWLYYRRLERAKFQPPERATGDTMAIDYRQLRWLLDGLALEQPNAQPEVKARTIV